MSNFEQYPYARSETDNSIYFFSSMGPKGEIKMVVKFAPTFTDDIFNLGFGHMKEDGSIDDSISNNNGDRNAILNTVATIISDFTESIPNCYIFFKGSTPARTRLYRMAITINLIFIASVYTVWGVLKNWQTEPFEGTQNYFGFLIKRK